MSVTVGVEEQCELSDQVQFIREELNRRKSAAQQADQYHGESLLSDKRFDECNISPLTVKALTAAGYLQMTKVQEATLSVCLNVGEFMLPKFKIIYMFEASEALQRTGLKSAFSEEAEFDEMVEGLKLDEGLKIDNVHHKSCIEVDEEGTEAAAGE